MRRLGPHRVWLAYKGLDSFSLALGWTLAPVFFVTELGLSPLELVLAGTALEVAYFLFEVPTGIVAEDAWLADEVGLENVSRSYQRGAQAARAGALAGIGSAVGLALVDLRAPVVAGGVAFVLLGALLALLMPETGFRPARHDGVGAFRAMARTGARGGRLLRGRPLLLLIVGIAFFAGMWGEGLDRLWEAHFLVDVGVPGFGDLDPVVWFGVLNAGVLLLAIVVAHPLQRRFERLGRVAMTRLLLGFDALSIAGTLAFAFAGTFALAVAAFWATRVVRSLAAPVYATWLNTSVDDSSVRATVISMTNLGDSAGEWGGGPALGGLGNMFGIRTALATGAAALVPALGLYARALKHEGRTAALSVTAQPAEGP